jgi:hypothetical protein
MSRIAIAHRAARSTRARRTLARVVTSGADDVRGRRRTDARTRSALPSLTRTGEVSERASGTAMRVILENEQSP